MENFEQMISRKRNLFKGGFGCGIGTAVINPLYTNSIQNYQFVISWILKGKGKYTEEGRVYLLRDACVCMRRPDRDYRMELEPESGIRLYLSLSNEIYSSLSYLIPELSTLPPVWGLLRNIRLLNLRYAVAPTESLVRSVNLLRWMIGIYCVVIE